MTICRLWGGCDKCSEFKGKRNTDEYRIVQMTRENGTRQTEGEEDLKSVFAFLRWQEHGLTSSDIMAL
jgi:hypothetical protein